MEDLTNITINFTAEHDECFVTGIKCIKNRWYKFAMTFLVGTELNASALQKHAMLLCVLHCDCRLTTDIIRSSRQRESRQQQVAHVICQIN
jgi:hypothetical protein